MSKNWLQIWQRKIRIAPKASMDARVQWMAEIMQAQLCGAATPFIQCKAMICEQDCVRPQCPFRGS